MADVRYKQSYAYSCGAVNLMCTAGELGVTSLGKHGKFALLEKETPSTGNGGGVHKALMSWDGKEYAGATFANAKVKNAVYAITSGDMRSYSLQSRVVACARQLGLKSNILCVPSCAVSGSNSPWLQRRTLASRSKPSAGPEPGTLSIHPDPRAHPSTAHPT